MTLITKLSLALLLGASLAACSEQSDSTNNDRAQTSPTVEEQESHEGHAHNETDKQTEAATASSDDPFQLDVHYRILATTFTADKNQVNEFFWYGCPACKATEPLMNKLKANQDLKVEVKGSLLNEKWVFDAIIYEAFKHFNVLDTAHSAYFEVRQNGSVKDQTSFNAFLRQQGIDVAEFEAFIQADAMKKTLDESFAIESQLQSTGVPTLIVAGKYVLINRGFDNIDDMHNAIEWLSQK